MIPVERVTRHPLPPPSNDERRGQWYAKAARAGYPFMTGPRWQHLAHEYEREQMLDAAPSTDTYDYFEEVGHESH